MSERELVVKYIVNDYISTMEVKYKKNLKSMKYEFEDILNYFCRTYDFDEDIVSGFSDYIDELREEYEEPDNELPIRELEQEEYYSNVIAPQKF